MRGMNESERYRGSSAFMTHEHRLLMLQRDVNAPTNANKWGIIGGESEGNETSFGTIFREVLEETCIRPATIIFIGRLRDSDTDMYHIPLTDDEARQILLGDEGEELRFFTLPELDNIQISNWVRDSALPQFREFLEMTLGTDSSTSLTASGY